MDDRLHRVRDMNHDEDRSQIRTGGGPASLSSLRNLAITILQLARIAVALHYHSRSQTAHYERS